MTSDVTLRVPAEPSYFALVRTAAVAVAARADFTLDALDDFKLAVDEACNLLYVHASPGQDLTVVFRFHDGMVTIDLSVPSRTGVLPRQDTVHWMLLSALVDSAEARVEDGIVHVRLRCHGISAVAS